MVLNKIQISGELQQQYYNNFLNYERAEVLSRNSSRKVEAEKLKDKMDLTARFVNIP